MRKLIKIVFVAVLLCCVFALGAAAADNCNHNWQTAYYEAADCTKAGGATYICTICGDMKSEYFPVKGHAYGNFIYNDDATCTKDGTKIGTCKTCGVVDMMTDKGSAKGHDFSGAWSVVKEANCSEQGVSKQICKNCGQSKIRYDGYGSHKDANGNYKCDFCGINMSPSTDYTDPDDGDIKDETIKNCSCKCHKGGISGFLWKIGNFFAKLFKVKSKQICACGIYHF